MGTIDNHLLHLKEAERLNDINKKFESATHLTWSDLGRPTLQNVLLTGQMFRHAGGRDPLGHEFNVFDNPGTFFYRVFFDFSKPSGLLYMPSNEFKDYKDTDSWWDKNSHYSNCAYNYLLVNQEIERAAMLRKFIKLLSNISVYSPWYFVSVSGLGEMMKRDSYYTPGFTVGEPGVITIKCLPDAYDTRIGTMLDLYKSICISHKLHKFILPENLRQFDMYIYIFHNPVWEASKGILDRRGFNKYPPIGSFDHDIKTDEDLTRKGAVRVSSKLIELHGCEFDAGSNSTGYDTLDNTDGMHPEYTMSIKVKYLQEQRVNYLVGNKLDYIVVGDMVKGDLFESNVSTSGAAADIEGKQSSSGSEIQEDASFHNIYDNQASDKVVVPEVERVDDGKPGIGDNQKYRGGNGLIGGKISRAMDRIAGNIKQVGGAIASTVGSYLDPTNLINMGLDAAGDLINRLTFGNLFYDVDGWGSLDSAASNISSKISQFSANSLVNKGVSNLTTKGGWTRSTATSQLEQNIFDEDR